MYFGTVKWRPWISLERLHKRYMKAGQLLSRDASTLGSIMQVLSSRVPLASLNEYSRSVRKVLVKGMTIILRLRAESIDGISTALLHTRTSFVLKGTLRPFLKSCLTYIMSLPVISLRTPARIVSSGLGSCKKTTSFFSTWQRSGVAFAELVLLPVMREVGAVLQYSQKVLRTRD